MYIMNKNTELTLSLYGVYIEVDSKDRVVKIFSDLFETPADTSILVEKGCGDRFAHAHLYLDKSLNDGVSFNYKYTDGEIIERTEEEKQSDIVITPQEPTELEKAVAKIANLENELQITNVMLTDIELNSLAHEDEALLLKEDLQTTNQYLTDLELLVLENITKNI